MRGKWAGSLVWTAVMTVFVGLFILVGFTYPKMVRTVPLVIGLPTFALLLILLIGEFHPPVNRWLEKVLGGQAGGTRLGAGERKEQEFDEWRPFIVIIIWVFAFYILVFLFGFVLVSPVFIASFLIRKARMNRALAVTYALVATILIYSGMTGLLNVQLWTGAIPSLIPGILGGSMIPPL